MSWVFHSSKSTGAARLVLLSLANRANEQTWTQELVCWPKMEVIASEAGMSVRNAQRAVQTLVDIGEIRVQKHPLWEGPANHQPNCYILVRGDNLSPREKVRGDKTGGLGVTESTKSHSSTVLKETKEETKDSPISNDVSRLCDLLSNLIAENGSKKPTVSKTWLRDMELLIRKDGRPPDKVERAIRWCQQDSFWLRNIMSPAKLRLHYDRLRLDAMKPATNGNGKLDKTVDSLRDFAQRRGVLV